MSTAMVGPDKDASYNYEVVDGNIVEGSPTGAFEANIASMLFKHLHVVELPGRAVIEMLFQLNAEPRLQRRPDVAYVSHLRWPRERRVPRTEAWDVIPDLAIEVASRSNAAEEILVKIREYFQAGCLRVWVVYPTEDQIYVYESPTKVRILTRHDVLEDAAVLPGFRLNLADLFEDGTE